MTSKEALKELNLRCIRTNGIDDENHELYNIIEKDLEVLDILKNRFISIPLLLSSDSLIEFKSKVKNTELTDLEFKKIKEWLENV